MENLKLGENYVLGKDGFTQSYPVGTIIITIDSNIPDGWLLCDGRSVNFNDYKKLGNHLGVSSGTFNLPALVVNSTSNPNPRIPVSTVSSEPSYPNVFGHSHNFVSGNISIGNYAYGHNHNVNTMGSNAETHYHSHGISGNSNSSNAYGGSSGGRAAGPNGPYASGNAGQTNHAHGGGYWASGTDGKGSYHSHTVNLHSGNLQHSHSHNISTGNFVSSEQPSSTMQQSHYPKSKEVYFLIKC